jgi:hypothetical protein
MVDRTTPRSSPCGSTTPFTSRPAPPEQKAGNLRSNPTVILTTGCNQWDRGLDVVVEGDAVQVTRRRRPRAPRCRTGETPHPGTSPWSSTARDLDASLLRMARVPDWP